MGTYTSTRFAGTDLSGEHIGEAESKRLAGLIGSDSSCSALCSNTAIGSEAMQKIEVSFQLLDANGDKLKASRNVLVETYDDDMVLQLTAAITCTVSTGAAVSADAQAQAVFSTDSDGVLVFDVEDISTMLAGDIHVVCTVLGGPTTKSLTTLTFA